MEKDVLSDLLGPYLQKLIRFLGIPHQKSHFAQPKPVGVIPVTRAQNAIANKWDLHQTPQFIFIHTLPCQALLGHG